MKLNFTTIIVAIIVLALLGFFALEVAGRPRDVKLRVTGMHCEGCADTVVLALKKLPQVAAAKVEFVDEPNADKPAASRTGIATVTIKGLSSPSIEEYLKAIKLGGDQFDCKLVE
jgi:copper chaperone CopZ